MADETHNNPAAPQGGAGRSGGERKSKAPAPKKKDSEAAAQRPPQPLAPVAALALQPQPLPRASRQHRSSQGSQTGHRFSQAYQEGREEGRGSASRPFT